MILEAVNILDESVKGQETVKRQRDERTSSTRGKRAEVSSDGNLLIWDAGSSAVQKAGPATAPHPSPNQQHLEAWWEMT